MPTNSIPFLVLAVGNRTVVVTDMGDAPAPVNVDNGVNWYWAEYHSIGFAKEGDAIDRDSCDYISGDFSEQKLCWHTNGMFYPFKNM